jgi:hypothetical protein
MHMTTGMRIRMGMETDLTIGIGLEIGMTISIPSTIQPQHLDSMQGIITQTKATYRHTEHFHRKNRVGLFHS